MPKKKNSVSAFGKSWNIVDIPNLERAVNLMERLVDLQNNFAGSLSKSSLIQSHINEKVDIQNELQELGIKLSKDQAQQVLNLLEARKKENEQLEQNTKYSAETNKMVTEAKRLQNLHKESTKPQGYNIDEYNTTKQGSIFSINNWASNRQAGINKKYYNKAVQNEISNLKSQGSIGSDAFLEKMAKYRIKSGTSSESTKQLLQHTSKSLGASALLFQTAANIIKKSVDVVANIAYKGLQNQTSVYEDTFSNISVRNDLSRSQYFGLQSRTNNVLSQYGLKENIRTSEIQTQWNTLAEQGIGINYSNDRERDALITKSMESVLTNKIIPYLNTSDKYYQQIMVQRPEFNKQIRGIDLATKAIMKDSTVATEHLQDMITNLTPMAALAQQELGVQYAKTLGTYQSMRSYRLL